MEERLASALASGTESVVAWADILDRINVFPVPDGDTGRNLVISLSPFKQQEGSRGDLSRTLLLSARGNSGNIAARFFSSFIQAKDLDSLLPYCEEGRDLAYKAIKDPKEGTMLSLFDTLVEALKRYPYNNKDQWVEDILVAMEKELLATKERLPELKEAGVVDAGALGMFVFFDSCLNTLAGRESFSRPVADELKGYFKLSNSWSEKTDQGYCMDVVLKFQNEDEVDASGMGNLGESVVTIPDGEYLKIHLHAEDKEEVKKRLEAVGEVVSLAADDLEEQTRRFLKTRGRQAVHIMTDAAGSITRNDAAQLGITLLDSYVTVGGISLPETYVDSSGLFDSMRKGIRASTSQASDLERHKCYKKTLSVYDRVLYICVGSFYTGNYQAALDWKADNDPDNKMEILDSGSASGRLGLAVMAAARLSLSSDDPEEVINFARVAVRESQELIFLDKLHYLAAGGRMSKTGAFFGDALHIKPVVTPAPDGAKKVAVVRNRKDQIDLALNRLESSVSGDAQTLIMLEYTDNREWVGSEVKPNLEARFPDAEFILQPLSLTSSVHMGPGTWGVAFLPIKSAELLNRV
ncbi:DegV family protein [Thermodesulfobacteriota bacterium]